MKERWLRTLLLLFLFTLPVFPAQHVSSANAQLATADYDLAELVFRQYVDDDPKPIYQLSYGTNDAVLPADFLARFKGDNPLVRSMTNGLTVVSNRFVLDKITRKEAVGLGIQQLRVTGDKADVQVLYFASGTSILKRYVFVRKSGQWSVKEKKTVWIACRG